MDQIETQSQIDDARMRRVAHNDAEAFGQIVREYQQRVFAFAARMLNGDVATAQDIAQETFLRLWRQRAVYRAQGTLLAYLLRIVYNLCLDARRSYRPQIDLSQCAELADDRTAVEDRVVAASLSDAVRQSMACLPEAQRAVFILSHYEQLSYREIAEALHCPIGTVASRKFLAVEALRKALQPWIVDRED